MELPKVLILGRPNVGKSTLINRLLKKRAAITMDEPGITRDLNEFVVEHPETPFIAVDSGGILAEKNNCFEFQEEVEELALRVIKEVSAIVFVVDVQDGLLPVDKRIADILRREVPEKVILAANKTDNDDLGQHTTEFFSLGLGKAIPVSGLHGRGIGQLVARITKPFAASEKQTERLSTRCKVGILGRPNVGKSCLINALVQSDQVIVSPKSGTTRDAIHLFFQHGEQTYEFIDTAGIRRQTKMKQKVEFFSVVRTKKVIEESTVILLVIDAERGFSNQDKKIANLVWSYGKSMIVVVNKSDQLELSDQVKKDFRYMMISGVPQLENYPMVFVSALKKTGITPLFNKLSKLLESIDYRIPTKLLNDFNRDVIKRFPAPAKYGKQVKIYYLTQVETHPPTFVFFVNHIKYLKDEYKRFLEKRMRTYLGGFEGHTLQLIFKHHREEKG